MSDSRDEDRATDPNLVRIDGDGRRHYRVPISTSGRGRERGSLVMEFSLAPFSSEPGSPWMRLINLLVEAMVDESMKEMEQGQPSIRRRSSNRHATPALDRSGNRE